MIFQYSRDIPASSLLFQKEQQTDIKRRAVERAKQKREEQRAMAASQTSGVATPAGDAMEEPPAGLSAMERQKWKMQLKKKKMMEQQAEQSSTW
jgi:hypothetical protein